MTHALLGAVVVWVVALTYLVGDMLRRRQFQETQDRLVQDYVVKLAGLLQELSESQKALLAQVIELKAEHDKLAARAFTKGEVH